MKGQFELQENQGEKKGESNRKKIKSKIKTLINLKRRDGRGEAEEERNLGCRGSKKKVERKRVGKDE
jgi:hypothetical protein